MKGKFKVLSVLSSIIIFIGIFIGIFISTQKNVVINNEKLLSGFVEKVTDESPTPTQISPFPTAIPVTSTPTFTPKPIDYRISFIYSPQELMEGGLASFTWEVDGSSKTIHKSAVYFGTINVEGMLGKDVAPAETKYTDSVIDFIDGDFDIPMRFIGNTIITKPGKYYARVYALIDSKNYWSEERVFTVKPIPTPTYEIKLINYSQKVKLNDNSSFTWDISGPQSTTSFTAVVGSKESKSGKLDETIDLAKTPYKILVNDFINGVYTIPLRYIGNTIMPEYGTYYIRALTIINGKNIWSDEHTISVQ